MERWKQSIRQEENKTVIFVGVHCRKTDYDARLRATGGCIVDHRFYDAALDIYRRRYNDEKNKVIFLAVSDDPNWMKVIWKFVFS